MGVETIGRASAALLSLLDLTSQGVGPDKLDPSVTLGMPGLVFLGDPTFAAAENSGAIAAGATAAEVDLTVPAGKAWIIRGVQAAAQMDLSAGVQRCRSSVSILGSAPMTGSVSAPIIHIWPGDMSPSSTATVTTDDQLLGFHYEFKHPLILKAGQIIRHEYEGYAGNAGGTIYVGCWGHEIPA